MIIWNDGASPGVMGQSTFGLVGGNVVFGQQSSTWNEGGVVAPVSLNGAGSVLNVTITGKTSTTSGSAMIFRI
jgi:hypothetical protein